MFGLAKPLVAALLINMSCPQVSLEYVQPHPKSAEFAAAYLINHFDDSLSVPETRLGHNYSAKLDVSSILLQNQNEKTNKLSIAPDRLVHDVWLRKFRVMFFD